MARGGTRHPGQLFGHLPHLVPRGAAPRCRPPRSPSAHSGSRPEHPRSSERSRSASANRRSTRIREAPVPPPPRPRGPPLRACAGRRSVRAGSRSAPVASSAVRCPRVCARAPAPPPPRRGQNTACAARVREADCARQPRRASVAHAFVTQPRSAWSEQPPEREPGRPRHRSPPDESVVHFAAPPGARLRCRRGGAGHPPRGRWVSSGAVGRVGCGAVGSPAAARGFAPVRRPRGRGWTPARSSIARTAP